MSGKVYLVGGGPGEAGLITEKGRRVLVDADCVIYDRLVNNQLLDHTEEAELIYAGKKAGDHFRNQQQINELLFERSLAGEVVVRLKGGDPYLLGRGGEEALYLAERGVDFEIVPGISSSLAAPAYAGIPLTHRDYSSSLAIITGHRREDEEVEIPRADTLVILMGVKNIQELMNKAREKGYSSDTPAAIITRATTPRQQVTVGKVETLPELVEEKNISPPGVIVVGEVVELHTELNFSEQKPLFGKKILLTRPASKSGDLRRRFIDAGAEVIEFPTVKLEPAGSEQIDRFLDKLEDYRDLIFTSSRGVEIFMSRLFERSDARQLAGKNICAIGPVTAGCLEKFGIRVDFVPEEYRAEALLEFFPKELAGRKVLLPRSDVARDVLPEQLRENGAEVDVLPVYRQLVPEPENKSAVRSGGFDIITFTSSSTADNFFKIINDGKAYKLLSEVLVCCIGPITARALRKEGIEPDLVAEEYTTEGLFEVLIDKLKAGEL